VLYLCDGLLVDKRHFYFALLQSVSRLGNLACGGKQ
jgi:hypothetical protein